MKPKLLPPNRDRFSIFFQGNLGLERLGPWMNGCKSWRDTWKGQEGKSSYREIGRERGGLPDKNNFKEKEFLLTEQFQRVSAHMVREA